MLPCCRGDELMQVLAIRKLCHKCWPKSRLIWLRPPRLGRSATALTLSR
jgi:hypothetical protein